MPKHDVENQVSGCGGRGWCAKTNRYRSTGQTMILQRDVDDEHPCIWVQRCASALSGLPDAHIINLRQRRAIVIQHQLVLIETKPLQCPITTHTPALKSSLPSSRHGPRRSTQTMVLSWLTHDSRGRLHALGPQGDSHIGGSVPHAPVCRRSGLSVNLTKAADGRREW